MRELTQSPRSERHRACAAGLSEVGLSPFRSTQSSELCQQLTTDRLAVERLAGLERLITILVARGLQPVFVLEDTEAAIGGAGSQLSNAFLDGPVRAFVHEVEAACLIAIQDVFTDAPAFGQLAASMALIEIPRLDDVRARQALEAIVGNRMEQYQLTVPASETLGADAVELLIAFYDETERNLRFTLAALQSAAEYAADMRSERIRAGHVRAATSDWRARLGP